MAHIAALFACLCYAVALVLFVRLLIGLGTTSLLGEPVSNLANGANARLFLIYGLAGTAGIALLAFTVWLTPDLPRSTYLASLLAGGVVMRLGLLALPTDEGGAISSRTGALHYAFAIASFALAYMAIDVGQAPLSALSAPPLFAVLRWSAAVTLAAVVVTMAPSLRRVFGLAERLFLATVLVWGLCASLALAGLV